ncbi:MAG: hypothetical protein AB7U34_05545 [Novosphingobium sp.]
MKAAKAKLRRLQRLERIRAIAKQSAALEAAQAEDTLARLLHLSAHTDRLATGYRIKPGPMDGASLQRTSTFASALLDMSTTTTRDADQAKVHADTKQADLARAERRRAAVDDRARLAEQALEKHGQSHFPSERRRTGTGLE